MSPTCFLCARRQKRWAGADMAMANYTAPSNETQEVVGFLIVLRMVHAGLADANILMQPEWCCTATVSLVACGMQGTA